MSSIPSVHARTDCVAGVLCLASVEGMDDEESPEEKLKRLKLMKRFPQVGRVQ